MKIISVTAQPHIFITMPVEALIEAGITPTDAVEIYAEDGKVMSVPNYRLRTRKDGLRRKV
nr:hypothetical protein [uncultured Ruminococcus sp.]